ncbi:UDP-glucuronosyltransferase 2A1-like [Danio aesculapii]|uniref:UDP-glucuronosyltransferase 2A1-like n=1 Tax=Danio aesculapii TaxID=1142201 RepID=UPI0024C09E5C|nr:UDP-glucuronosyltransferase 2A1-like [Danio aesculapii]
MYLSANLGLFILLCALSRSYASKLLVVPVEGSHWVNMKVLIVELHSRGHSITVVRGSSSWYIEEQSPLYTSITVDNGEFDDDFMEKFLPRLLKMQRQGKSFWNEMALADEMIRFVTETHKQSCNMTAIMFENETLMNSLKDAAYDVVLTDPAYGSGVLLAHHLGLPLVYNVRWTVYGEAHFDIAPSPLSYIPVSGLQLTDKMTFSQRVMNIMTYIMIRYKYSKNFGSPYQEFTQKYFGPNVNFFSLLQDADLWLMRNDFTFEFPRPTMPNVVYMGGFQCKPAKPLPGDLDRENMQRLSKLHHDQPMKPLDRAIFWIEFVIRNKGAPHLRAQSFRMSWIEHQSIDVILTLMVMVFVFALVTAYTMKYFCLRLFRKKVKHE